jgi:prophage maintenance system killer protein
MDLLYCPSVEEIQYYNTIAIEMFRKSKHDEAKIINVSYIEKAIEKVKNKQGNLYDKAALMLYELTQIHAFESGNNRTAFLTTKKFVIKNEGKFKIPDSTNNVKVMIGIRENYYSLNEIKEWIKNGKIKEFRR